MHWISRAMLLCTLPLLMIPLISSPIEDSITMSGSEMISYNSYGNNDTFVILEIFYSLLGCASDLLYCQFFGQIE